MSILQKHIAFVNEQIAVQSKLATKFEGQEWRHKLHTDSCENFRQLSVDLADADRQLDEYANNPLPRTETKPSRLSLAPEDIQGLPAELLEELSSGADKTEFAIIQVINERGGIASLDQILVGVYKRTGEVFKRSTMTSRLYRMAQKSLVFSVPTKKGAYSTDALSESEVTRLLGGESQDSDSAQNP